MLARSGNAPANRCGYKFTDDDDPEYGDENDGDLLIQKLVDRGIEKNTDATGSLIAQTQDALVVRGDDEPNVLLRNVPEQIGADIAHAGGYPKHKAKIEKGTKLWDILKADEIEVNSSHHQAVKDVPEPIIVSATSKDGVIEAIESTRHRHALGIQWHPERLIDRHGHLSLFQALVQEAARR